MRIIHRLTACPVCKYGAVRSTPYLMRSCLPEPSRPSSSRSVINSSVVLVNSSSIFDVGSIIPPLLIHTIQTIKKQQSDQLCCPTHELRLVISQRLRTLRTAPPIRR